MRWESDFATLATLHDCRSPQANLSSLVRETTEIRERCAATAQPDVQSLQSTNTPYPQGPSLRWKQ
jgi:hypothetical protein